MANCGHLNKRIIKGLCQPCYLKQWKKDHKKRHYECSEASFQRRPMSEKRWKRHRSTVSHHKIIGKQDCQFPGTKEEFITWFEEQLKFSNGKCQCCGALFLARNQEPHLDHCHMTGKLRGLLCQKCNVIEGLIRDKDHRIDIIQYLEERCGK